MKELFRPEKGTRIVDIGSREQYEVATGLVLGQGAYGVVYGLRQLRAPGSLPASAHPVDRAVLKLGKVLPEHLKNETVLQERLQTLQQVFKREEENIRLIRDRSGGRFAPWASLAELPASSSADAVVPPLLLMQKIPAKWRLHTQLDTEIPHAKEMLAARTGVQYTQLLKILHDDLDFTCADRKRADVHWDPQELKLYLLDWNVTELREQLDKELTAVGEQDRDEKWDEVRQKAIRTFGSLWCELLGIDMSVSLELQVEMETDDPTPWGQLSQAMRRLLLRTMDSTGGWGFTEATELHGAWKRHLSWLEQPSEALKVARSFMDDPDMQWRERWETVSDVIDLLERYARGRFESDLDELRAWASNAARIQDESFKNALASPMRNVTGGFYDAALEALAEMRQDVQWEARSRLTASRWYLAAKALDAWSLLSSRTQGEIVPILRRLVKELERHGARESLATQAREGALHAYNAAMQKARDLTPAPADWTEPKSSSRPMPSTIPGSAPMGQPDVSALNQVNQILDVFDWELAWWEQLGHADPSRELSGRLDALHEAQRAMNVLGSLDPIHADLLLAVAPFPLESAIAELARKKRRQDSLRGVREREAEILQQIFKRLDQALKDKMTTWPGLGDLLRERPDETWLEPLVDLDLGLQQGMNRDILDRTGELLPRLRPEPDLPDLADVVVKLVRVIGYREVDRSQKRARWSDEVDYALDLIAGLSNPPWSSSEGVLGQRLAEVKARLEEKKRQTDALRLEWQQAGGRRPLDYPNNQALDAILRNAVSQGIEFLADRDDNRSPLGAAEVLQQRKANRHGAQLKGTNESLHGQLQGLTALVNRVREARQELSDLVTQLETQNQRLDEMLTGLQNQLGDVASLSQSSAVSGVAVDRAQVDALRAEIEELAASAGPFWRQGEQKDTPQLKIDPLTDGKRTEGLLQELEVGAVAGPDTLGRPELREKLYMLQLQRNLSHKEHARLEILSSWQQWASQYRELASTWRRPGSLYQAANLERLVASADQLLQAAPSDLPSQYWQEISGILRRVYETMVSLDDRTEFSRGQLVQVGLFYHRVTAQLSAKKDSA